MSINKKISEFDSVGYTPGTLSNNDYLVVLDDPSGTPVTKKVSIAEILNYRKGSSFPGGARSGDRFFRTDLGWWCYYDGTRWLTEHELTVRDNQVFLSSDSSETFFLRDDYDAYFMAISTATYASATHDATNYWTITIETDGLTQDGTWTTVYSFNTSTDNNDQWIQRDIRGGSLTNRTVSTDKLIRFSYTKTNSPGNLWCRPVAHYQLIVT